MSATVDFDRESLPTCLEGEGFDKDRRSLFILEGLLMYLLPGSVHETFDTIQRFATTGSEIVFDYVYASVLRGEGLRYGERGWPKLSRRQEKGGVSELRRGGLGAFLARYGMSVIEEKDSTGLEEMYFTGCTGAAGNKVGRVNGTHCLVHGVVDSHPLNG